uniref:CUB domain-containing protein n=1 Tax=Heterorhabditis bacteriophora TaxID=37862 RepID=A0A1I7XG19_HETBA
MFIIQSKQPSYCGHSFASSSCQTEYNGKVESALEAKTSLGGLSKGLRRNSSNLSQLYVQDHCVADATQIEIDVSSITNSPFFIRIVTPCGESGVLHFTQYGTAQVFKPQQHGCGHGIWKFEVYQFIDNSETLLISETMQLYGVGTLFFTVDDDLHPRLSGQEFLYMSGLCAKLRT